MKIAIVAFALIVASLASAPSVQAEDCYWDRAQQARVCHPSPAEREAWRRGREHGEREHERHRGWYEHEHHYPHGWLYDHGYYRQPH
jgi:Ni/Co efflux regulator RcnB